ncbi:hypothetical protein [Brevundimonas sp. SORGH_AS_0993]|uniref:hypothetical protein n=1 Tax=Brevundimonas sp. SORGH_AS_0993 TaxID=3041794 RepID=UPI002787FE37|nr:hypothetical protein [Brevundimonas sp. SORGH_AS_0993]MDQ1154703.1 putative lipoprotein [Brevundimonas sp. SORGH_AS_0993]
MRSLVLAAVALPLLSACASTGGVSSYQKDLDRLEASCKAREGILTPTGMQTGHPETEYACTIVGGATRISRN